MLVYGRLRINGSLGLNGSISCGCTVELAVEACIGNCARTCSSVGLVISGTEPVLSIINHSNDGLALCVVSVNGGSGCLVCTVNVSAGNYHIDIELGAVSVKSVEVVTIGGLLEINVDCSVYIGSSSHIVTVHTALKVVDSVLKVALNHTELVCSACNRINYAESRSLGSNVVRIGLAALALTLYEVVLVYGRLRINGSLGVYSSTISENDCDGCPVHGVTIIVLEIEVCVSIRVRSDGIGLCALYSRKLGAESSALNFVTEGEDNSIGVIIGILRAGVNKLDFLNTCSESRGVPEHRSFAILVSHLETVAVVTELNPLECNAANSSGRSSVVLAGNTKAINSKLNLCAVGCGRSYRLVGSLGINGGIRAALAGNDGDDPRILHLSSVVVVTNSTVNGDGIANSGLSFHSIESEGTVCTVCAIKLKLVARLVNNVHVTVCRVGDLGDLTGYIELTVGSGYNLETKVNSLFDGKSRTVCRLFNRGSFLGSKRLCVLRGDELCYELGAAYARSAEVRPVGDGESCEVIVCTEAIVKAVDIGAPCATLFVIEYGAFFSGEAYELANLAVAGSLGLSENVSLNAINLGVELIAVINLLYEEVSGFLGIIACKNKLILVVLGLVKSKESLSKLDLIEGDLVRYALLRCRNNTCKYRNLEGVGPLLGSAVCSRNGSSKGVGELFLSNKGKDVYSPGVNLGALGDNNVFVIRGPGYVELNAIDSNRCDNVEVLGGEFALFLINVMKESNRIRKIVRCGRGVFICAIVGSLIAGLSKATDDVLDHVAACEHANGESEHEK